MSIYSDFEPLCKRILEIADNCEWFREVISDDALFPDEESESIQALDEVYKHACLAMYQKVQEYCLQKRGLKETSDE